MSTTCRILRRAFLKLFRPSYVRKQFATRKGVCGRHGCCDLSYFFRNRDCLDPDDRTNCLKRNDLPPECMLYPIDEKDKIAETRGYCNFYWEDDEK